MKNGTVVFKHPVEKRTRHIWYEGTKYHRRCEWHGYSIYIIGFAGVNRALIEIPAFDNEQRWVEVDDAEFNLIEYKSNYPSSGDKQEG